MKRDIEEGEIVSDTESEDSVADTLMLLSRIGQPQATSSSVVDRVFECKSCKRQFTSFQALGGHRASHKKPKPSPDGPLDRSPPKPKPHECSICGQEFAIGQALGGHMRRHRAVLAGVGDEKKQPAPADESAAAVNKSGGMSVRFDFDLNLTPLENEFKFLLGRTPNYVGCQGA